MKNDAGFGSLEGLRLFGTRIIPSSKLIKPGLTKSLWGRAVTLDEMDIKILRILQEDCTIPVAEMGKKIGLSTTPCWRRIQKLEEAGVIRRRVALLDAGKVRAGVNVFVSIVTNQHSLEWLARFHKVLEDFPEVVEFYRMSGQIDYLIRVVVPDIAAYDTFYKRLITRIDLSKVSSAFAMEQIKFTTALPLEFANGTGGD